MAFFCKPQKRTQYRLTLYSYTETQTTLAKTKARLKHHTHCHRCNYQLPGSGFAPFLKKMVSQD